MYKGCGCPMLIKKVRYGKLKTPFWVNGNLKILICEGIAVNLHLATDSSKFTATYAANIIQIYNGPICLTCIKTKNVNKNLLTRKREQYLL